MHELAASKALLNLISKEALDRGIEKPIKAVVSIGFFTTYSGESIKLYFELLQKDYPGLEYTDLVVEEVEGRVHCKKCKAESIVDTPYIALCPKCESHEVEVLSGREFKLKEIFW